jgi:hypothetical protein
LSKAGCALEGATISGRVMPFVSRAQSRYVFIASMMLSVPPEESAPQMCSSGARPALASAAPSMRAVMATTSASNLVALGQRSACSGLACELMAYTRLRKSMWLESPWYTAPDT